MPAVVFEQPLPGFDCDAQIALQKAQDVLAEVSGDNTDIAVTLFSALSRQGLGDVAETLYDWVHAPARPVESLPPA